ncbi:unnamed protein product [Candida parapsilosis]
MSNESSIFLFDSDTTNAALKVVIKYVGLYVVSQYSLSSVHTGGNNGKVLSLNEPGKNTSAEHIETMNANN